MASEMARQAAAEYYAARIDGTVDEHLEAMRNDSPILKMLDRFEAAVRADQMERDAKVATQIASATNEDGVQIYKDHVCMGAEMAAAAILSQKEPQG